MYTLLISVLVINSVKPALPHLVVYSILTFSCHCLVSDATGQGGPLAQPSLSFCNLQHPETPHVVTLLVVPQVRVSHLHANLNPKLK